MTDPDRWRVDIETRVRSIETNQAVNSERYDQISLRLGKIDAHVTWLVRLVVGGTILALLAFINGGGLAGIVGG